MDNEKGAEPQVPFNVLSDSYRVWVPIEDQELLKSVSIDGNGDFIVQGVMSADDLDEENDSITPEGMDCSYFLTKGWIKYEHGNNPNNFIGEPLEVRVGKFEHPTLHKSVNGIFVKARLFANRELTRQAVQAIEDLQKSHTKRRMGWSIEGNVKERCRKTGKVLKSVLRNCVLTMNPVNTVTWAELAKSFAKNHEVEVDMEMDKSMDTGAIAEITRQSLEGAPKVQAAPDPQEEWIKLFRAFARETALQKSLRTAFAESTAGEVGLSAYTFAINSGVAYTEACEFASYIADRQEILKSLFGKIGGEDMSKEQKSALAELLDTNLEELQKSLQADESDEEGTEDEELEKSVSTSDEDGDEDDTDNSEDESEDDGDDDSDDEGDEGDDDEDDKPQGSSLRKSLAESGNDAFEVSEFLTELTDKIGYSLEGLEKSLTNMTKQNHVVTEQQGVIVKSLLSLGQVVQEMTQKVEGLEAENSELRKSLDTIAERPVGRKSVVNQREVQTLQKSIGSEPGKPLTRREASEILTKSFEIGEINGTELVRFEGGVPLGELRLPVSVKSKLGLS